MGLCLRIIPQGESLEFVLEKDKIEKIKRVIFNNGGEVIEEVFLDKDVKMKVSKKGSCLESKA